jgi:hypothetical protein
VPLGTAANFALLSPGAIVNGAGSVVTGNVGGAVVTGFVNQAVPGEPAPSKRFQSTSTATSKIIDGHLYHTTCAVPTPDLLALAIADMKDAYTAACNVDPGLAITTYTNHAPNGKTTATLGGGTWLPGLYKYTTFMHIVTDINLEGGPDDVFVFQITAYLTMAASAKINLVAAAGASGPPQAASIVWAVGTYVTFGASVHLEGTYLVVGAVVFGINASLKGRLLGQGAITLGSTTITNPLANADPLAPYARRALAEKGPLGGEKTSSARLLGLWLVAAAGAFALYRGRKVFHYTTLLCDPLYLPPTPCALPLTLLLILFF